MVSRDDEPSMRSKGIKIALVVVLLGAAGLIVYKQTGANTIEQPDTPETATTYVCVECDHGADLTAAQYSDMVKKERAENTAAGEMGGSSFLRCPKCNKPAMAMGMKCPKDGTPIPLRTKDGKPGRCTKCGYSAMGN